MQEVQTGHEVSNLLYIFALSHQNLNVQDSEKVCRKYFLSSMFNSLHIGWLHYHGELHDSSKSM